MKGIKNCNDDDLIILSDVDETPDLTKLNQFNKKNKYVVFSQRAFAYKLNLLNETENNWHGSRMCLKKHLKSPQWLRNIKTAKPPFWKFYKPRQPQLIYDGGWHFSFLKNPKGISKKIQSYSHSEYNKSIYTDEKKIAERINNRIDIFDRNFKYEKIDIDDTFPKYILENINKYKDWII